MSHNTKMPRHTGKVIALIATAVRHIINVAELLNEVLRKQIE
jgi:hypothetical protein